jgi:hypothetical protein
MPALFYRIERRARFLMGGVAFLTFLIFVLFKTHMVETQPSFDAYGWYTVNTLNSSVAVTRRAESEAACVELARTYSISCLQGKFLNAGLVESSNMH